MDKLIALNTDIINRQDGNVENKGIIYVGKPINSVPIRYLVIENNVYNIALMLSIMTLMILKKATILWSVAHWGQYPVCRTNDNGFIFNRMLGYNTALYDDKH